MKLNQSRQNNQCDISQSARYSSCAIC